MRFFYSGRNEIDFIDRQTDDFDLTSWRKFGTSKRLFILFLYYLYYFCSIYTILQHLYYFAAFILFLQHLYYFVVFVLFCSIYTVKLHLHHRTIHHLLNAPKSLFHSKNLNERSELRFLRSDLVSYDQDIIVILTLFYVTYIVILALFITSYIVILTLIPQVKILMNEVN